VKVIYCYCETNPHSEFAIRKFAPRAEWINTSGSIYDYNYAIQDHWTGKEDLVVIEGDKEITHEVLPSFTKCKKPWCSFSSYIFPKSMGIETFIGLGCTRYSAKLQQMVDTSEFLCDDDPIWSVCPHCQGKGCWRYLDSRMAKAIRNHEIDVHVHGHVKHYHDYGILGQLCE
jgi:hypothetical protein